MTIRRAAKETVKFVDDYGEQYRALVSDVRSFEYFKALHIGLWSEVPRKTLPAIAKAVGEADSQDLHHWVADGDWQVEVLREKRLGLLAQALDKRTFVLCIDETGTRRRATLRTMPRGNTSATWGK